MDPFTTVGEHRHGRSLVVTLLSLLCALAGLILATTSAGADETPWLVAGVALGVLGPVLIGLLAGRSP